MTASSPPADAGPLRGQAPRWRPRRRDEVLAAAAALFAAQGYRSTSMREVAAASGILAGSLYHHFPSKEAIAVELIEEYHAALDHVVREFRPGGAGPVADVRSFARQVAAVTAAHRAAYQISVYDAPAAASEALKAAVRHELGSLDRRWLSLIEAVSAACPVGAAGQGMDTAIVGHVLAATIPQLVGVTGDLDPGAAADCVTSIVFDGLAADGPALRAAEDGAGAGPDAIGVVGQARARWAADARARQQDRRGVIFNAARAQFALRGFEATTMRDIADAAGLPAGNIYRYFESKDAMVSEILSEFSDRLLDAYQAVLAVGAPAAESLDALCWLLDQAGRHFGAEIDMLKGNGKVLSLPVAAHYRAGAVVRYSMLVGLIKSGVAAGELRDLAEPELVAACVREIMWAPMRYLSRVPPARVRAFVRGCVLGGAARG